MENDKNKTDVSFLDGLRLSEEQKKKILEVAGSRDLRILVFSQLQNIFLSNPKSQDEAAAKYYEAKGLMSLLTITN